jgi:hypothetical protein
MSDINTTKGEKMSLYLRDQYFKEIAKLKNQIARLEDEKKSILDVNPNDPLRSLYPKIGLRKRKLKQYIEKYKDTYYV